MCITSHLVDGPPHPLLSQMRSLLSSSSASWTEKTEQSQKTEAQETGTWLLNSRVEQSHLSLAPSTHPLIHMLTRTGLRWPRKSFYFVELQRFQDLYVTTTGYFFPSTNIKSMQDFLLFVLFCFCCTESLLHWESELCFVSTLHCFSITSLCWGSNWRLYWRSGAGEMDLIEQTPTE